MKARQFELLTILVSYHQRRLQQPSLRELARLMGIASVSTVHHHLTALERAGYLQRMPALHRSIRLDAKAFEHCRRSLRAKRASDGMRESATFGV